MKYIVTDVTYAWNPKQKRDYLLAQLSGEAADFATNLSPDKLSDYHSLVFELTTLLALKMSTQLNQHSVNFSAEP